MVADEPDGSGRQPRVHHQLWRQLGIARLVVVEDQARVSLRVPAVGIAADLCNWGICKIAYAESLECLHCSAAALMLLVDAPEWVDGLACCQHDLVLASGMVCNEVRDVVHPILVADPNASLLCGVLCNVLTLVGGPRACGAVNLSKRLQGTPHLLELGVREPPTRPLVPDDVNVPRMGTSIRADLGVPDVQVMALQQFGCLTEEAGTIRLHIKRYDTTLGALSHQRLTTDGLELHRPPALGPSHVQALSLLTARFVSAPKAYGACSHCSHCQCQAGRLAALRS
mmetsp:Transcript_45983/g.133234  ORF Transcript_45983/g.133234 Transcript_45983/m.133234 type:complete len:284 (-) Transcript_45983:246-1097(-)